MANFNEIQQEELLYLEKTLSLIKTEIEKEKEALNLKLGKVIASRKEMWQEVSHSSEDFDRIPEMNQYQTEVASRTSDYKSTEKRLQKNLKLIKSPYFGRFDFIEEGYEDIEKIYIGLYNLMDKKTEDIYVYDWRAPISSIFYRNELGKASYKSPAGMISGEVSLKRQYKIEASKLKYFFDSSITINDEILQEVLGRNSSPKMKSIVQTIQKEQDIIIRNTERDLLIVQGTAGSGKTSIALHRIAYLLYEGLSSKLTTNNILIISPNSIFSKYISDVLPELGEENVQQLVFDNLIEGETRQQQLEGLLMLQGSDVFKVKLESIQFKGSVEFVKILQRLISYYERRLIPFKDIYFHNKIIETAQELKSTFLNNKINMPALKRLNRIKSMLLNKIHPLRKERLQLIERVVESTTQTHMFEIKAFSRLIAIKEAKRLLELINSFTEVNFLQLYKMLFNDKSLFYRLSKGLRLPKEIDKIIEETKNSLNEGVICHEDASALLYIRLMLCGCEDFGEIKQVVIDEAQDYYPIHYHIFKLLFKAPNYTVLGDFNQTLEKQGEVSLYEYIELILQRKKALKLMLSKSYRSSFEISAFNKRLINNNQEILSFDRHGAAPEIKTADSLELLHETMLRDIKSFYESGYKSVAVICKTASEAKELYTQLKGSIDVKLLDIESYENSSSVQLVSSYMAKGLEFDAVLIYNVSEENYCSSFDKRLLYVSCTRALHRLALYYIGEKCHFI